jgi:hypothetical protein
MAKAKKSKAKKSGKKKAVKRAAAKARRAPAKKSLAKKSPAKKTKAKKTKKAAAKKPAPRKAKKAAPKKQTLIGEGDYAATRKFDKDQAGFVKKNKAKIPEMGKEAEKALDGPEGDSLRAAEQEAMNRSTID